MLLQRRSLLLHSDKGKCSLKKTQAEFCCLDWASYQAESKWLWARRTEMWIKERNKKRRNCLCGRLMWCITRRRRREYRENTGKYSESGERGWGKQELERETEKDISQIKYWSQFTGRLNFIPWQCWTTIYEHRLALWNHLWLLNFIAFNRFVSKSVLPVTLLYGSTYQLCVDRGETELILLSQQNNNHYYISVIFSIVYVQYVYNTRSLLAALLKCPLVCVWASEREWVHTCVCVHAVMRCCLVV